jgi:predicted DNA-binding protein with PD1-like motif
MISGESRPTRCVMGRLEAGEDVVAALRELARFERIDAGFVRAQGAVQAAELARYDAGARGYVPAGGVAGAAELVSLQGNVSLEGGVPDVRLWAVLAVPPAERAPAGPDDAAAEAGPMAVHAGMLVRARSSYVEFAIDVYDEGDLERRPDLATGLALWRPPRRR